MAYVIQVQGGAHQHGLFSPYFQVLSRKYRSFFSFRKKLIAIPVSFQAIQLRRVHKTLMVHLRNLKTRSLSASFGDIRCCSVSSITVSGLPNGGRRVRGWITCRRSLPFCEAVWCYCSSLSAVFGSGRGYLSPSLAQAEIQTAFCRL